jgi:hypothetical protein
VTIKGETKYKVTANPSGRLNINLSNGRVTLRGSEDDYGNRKDWFLQFGSLSFGSIISRPTSPGRLPEDVDSGSQISVTTFDFDYFGSNWLSWKLSQAQGETLSTVHRVGAVDVKHTSTNLAQIDMRVFRHPRLIAIAGGLFVLGKAGIALAPHLLGPGKLIPLR